MNNKKIIFQVTRIYMKKNWRRTLITYIGIIIMVVLMTSVFVGKDTILNFMEDIVINDQGSWHAQVYDISSKQVEEIRALDYVTQVEVARTLGYTEFAQSGNPDETPLLELKGYSSDMFDWMNIHVKEGRLPETENEVIISERAIKEGADIHIGDTISVEAFRRYLHAFGETGSGTLMFQYNSGFMVEHGDTVEVPAHFPYYSDNDQFEIIHEPTGLTGTYTVVGIMEMPYYEMPGQGGYMAIVKTSDKIAENERVNVVLQVDLKKHMELEADLNRIVNQDKTEEELNEMGGQYYVTRTGECIPVEQGRVVVNNMLLTVVSKGTDGTFNMILMFFQAFFIVLITVASFVLIYNVFNISFRERSKYLGMLSSVGATRAQKRWCVYYESFYLLLFALPLGILIGLLVVKGGMALLYPHFSSLINMVGDNVLLGRNYEIGYHIVVNPMNLLFITVFSILAVWVSAWLPARKIGKASAVESIRGNADTKAKSHKTALYLMGKGHVAAVLAAACVRRSRYSTKGIIRSITAFLTLTIVTAFGAQSLSDIVRQKVNDTDFRPGSIYSSYDYLVYESNEEAYEDDCKAIMESQEVSEYKEMWYNLFGLEITFDELSDEYKESLKKILLAYYPDGVPEEIEKSYLDPQYQGFYPTVNHVVVSDEDFAAIAANAGIGLDAYDRTDYPVLVCDTVEFTTDDYRVGYEDGSIKPDYTSYQLKYPLRCKVGEQFCISQRDYSQDEEENISIMLTLGGYVSDNDLKDYFSLKKNAIWMIVPASVNNTLFVKKGEIEPGVSERAMLFRVNTEESELIRKLASEKNEYGDNILMTAESRNYISFQTAISKILDIVAVCFTCLIAIICLLNLYNSVMGRRMARFQELAVLHSVGMTSRQRRIMLHMENLLLLLQSALYSGVISSVFVILLHKVMSDRFGRLLFHMPTMSILVALMISILALTFFTEFVYRRRQGNIMEDLRAEAL